MCFPRPERRGQSRNPFLRKTERRIWGRLFCGGTFRPYPLRKIEKAQPAPLTERRPCLFGFFPSLRFPLPRGGGNHLFILMRKVYPLCLHTPYYDMIWIRPRRPQTFGRQTPWRIGAPAHGYVDGCMDAWMHKRFGTLRVSKYSAVIHREPADKPPVPS